jgi:hypothetical protein
MKQRERHAALPFENIRVGRDLTVGFFTDYFMRLKQASGSGAFSANC